jgi:hypothetical protein
VQVNVSVTCLDSLVANIPTAFDPDSQFEEDRIFDPLAEISNECFEQPDNAELLILSRTGEVIYESRATYRPWMGRNDKDQQLPDGVYYYLLRFNLNGEQQLPIKGFVMLMSQGK